MQRSIVILLGTAIGLATPLAAQGHSGKQTRTYIDSRGRECRETTQYKGNGDSKYEVKCKSAKHHKGGDHDDRDDDDDYSDNRSCFDWSGSRCGTASRRSYPSTLPDMATAVIWGRGQRPSGATSWLGGRDYRVQYVDRDRDGRPESASWLGTDGRIVQQWIDTNRDGRADAVRLYRDGRLAKVLRS
jgi:hypothetical protein